MAKHKAAYSLHQKGILQHSTMTACTAFTCCCSCCLHRPSDKQLNWSSILVGADEGQSSVSFWCQAATSLISEGSQCHSPDGKGARASPKPKPRLLTSVSSSTVPGDSQFQADVDKRFRYMFRRVSLKSWSVEIFWQDGNFILTVEHSIVTGVVTSDLKIALVCIFRQLLS